MERVTDGCLQSLNKRMLNGISELLNGDILKALCDMGHGDMLVLADAHFPAESFAKSTTVGRVIRVSGVSVISLLEALTPLFPVDVEYSDYPAIVMDLTDSDKRRMVDTPVIWDNISKVLNEKYSTLELDKIERYNFYELAQKSYVIIQTGELRQYGNLILIKGCVK